MISDEAPGWVGSVEDLRVLTKDFGQFRREIISDMKNEVEHIHIRLLRGKNRSSIEFLNSLDEHLKAVEDQVKMSLTVISKDGNSNKYREEEIAEELKSLSPKNIESFEIKISCEFYFIPATYFKKFSISFIGSTQSRISVTADTEKEPFYLSRVKELIRPARPKYQWLASFWFSLFAGFSIGATALTVTFQLPSSFNPYLYSTLLIIIAIIELFFAWRVFKWLPKLSPKFELYSNYSKSTLERSQVKLGGIFTSILLPFLMWLFPKN